MYKNLLGVAAILFAIAAISSTLPKAQAYPTPSVSFDANPVVSIGGTISGTTTTVLTAPSDQMIVVTDVWLTMNQNNCTSKVTLNTSSGSTLAEAKLHSYRYSFGGGISNSHPTSIQHNFSSGLPIPVNESLEVTESGSCSVSFTISGYFAQP